MTSRKAYTVRDKDPHFGGLDEGHKIAPGSPHWPTVVAIREAEAKEKEKSK